MKLLIHLEIGNRAAGVPDPSWLHYASSLSSDILGTGLDNQCDEMVANLVLKMIDQSDDVFLLIESHDPTGDVGEPRRVIDRCLDQNESATIVLWGTREGIQGLPPAGIRAPDQTNVYAMIREFAQ